ncbi:hypothetical protein DXG01_008930 [Tephrocybe rancida]|nr:hypothetical protein DXG01_008930 [Tephrocybe rancida]
MGPLELAASTVFIVVLATLHARRSYASIKRKLPPGPRGIPILGNVLQVPGTHLATYFRGLLAEYGGLVSLNLAGFVRYLQHAEGPLRQPVVLIGDIKLAKNILDKHSAKHSSRPVVPYVRNHLNPTDVFWAASKDGKTHNIARKLTAGLMSAVRAGKTQLLQEFEAKLNIQKLLDDGGKDWYHHMERYIVLGGLFSRFLMGGVTKLRQAQLSQPALACTVPQATNQFSEEFLDIINVLPFLDMIPGPMPWRTRAKVFRTRDAEIYGKFVEEAVTGKTSGMNTWAAAFANVNKPDGDQRQLLSQVNARPFAGAPQFVSVYPINLLLTTSSSTTGKNTSFQRAVLSSLFRGLGSKRAIEHDVARFERPNDFVPERFLDAEGKLKSDYETSVFGFGRRGQTSIAWVPSCPQKDFDLTTVCPGVPFGERTLWISIVTMLWTFDIQGIDELDPNTGSPYVYDDSDAAFSGYVTSTPYKFPAIFRPRSLQREEVARREWDECEKDLNVLLPAPKDG